MPRTGRALALAGLILTLTLTAGCAGLIFTDPGPNPAWVTTPVKAQVAQSQVDDVIARFGGPIFLNTPPHYDTISGPFWDVQAFILAPDGGLHQLKPAPGEAIISQEGMALEGQSQFLAPPGRHKLRLVLSGLLLHTFYDDYGFWKVYIPLLTRYAEPEVELAPGQVLVLEDLLAPR